ncbi:hypothetical protein R3P38DRAFT_3214069 [Favolaschia claudopus]|uniref:Uncharacterized protein n=1 Tax=Favolaschia claudopus TaxID=2862362 RepID=A0AAW0AE89_9AGAR
MSFSPTTRKEAGWDNASDTCSSADTISAVSDHRCYRDDIAGWHSGERDEQQAGGEVTAAVDVARPVHAAQVDKLLRPEFHPGKSPS